MSNKLTIEQLKALPRGEWVWVVTLQDYYRPNDVPYGEYHEIVGTCSHYYFEVSYDKSDYYQLAYADYGTKWTAYKNKEQAEGKDKDMIERIEKAYEHNLAECERCMKKVDIKHQFAMESMKEHIRKETAKEIFDEVIEACTVQLNAAEVDEYDNRYSKAWGRYWEGKISGAMNCRADILNIAKKYGEEVDE